MFETVFEWVVLVRGAVVFWVLLDSLAANWQDARTGKVFEIVSLIVEAAIAGAAAYLLARHYFA